MFSGRDEVGQQAVGAGDGFRKLPIDGVGHIEVGCPCRSARRADHPAADPGLDRAASVSGVYCEDQDSRKEWPRSSTQPSKSAEVMWFGQVNRVAVGIEQSDGRVLVDDFLWIAPERERIRSRELHALVLDEEGAAVADVVEAAAAWPRPGQAGRNTRGCRQ